MPGPSFDLMAGIQALQGRVLGQQAHQQPAAHSFAAETQQPQPQSNPQPQLDEGQDGVSEGVELYPPSETVPFELIVVSSQTLGYLALRAQGKRSSNQRLTSPSGSPTSEPGSEERGSGGEARRRDRTARPGLRHGRHPGRECVIQTHQKVGCQHCLCDHS